MDEPTPVTRLLVVDDEPHVLDAFREVLAGDTDDKTRELEALEASLFEETTTTPSPAVEVVVFQQARPAVAAVREARAAGRPFAVAFVDVRMPPGESGVWAAARMREADPLCNIVIVTAYSDIPPQEIDRLVPPADKLFYLQKPVHHYELAQLSRALVARWHLERQLLDLQEHLQDEVAQRTRELASAMRAVTEENHIRRLVEEELRRSQERLQALSLELAGHNQALERQGRREAELRRDLEERVRRAMEEMVVPALDRLRQAGLSPRQRGLVDQALTAVQEATSTLFPAMGRLRPRFTPQEMHIAELIRQGLASRDIAQRLGVSLRTVEFHRDRIRAKLGLKHRRANLRAVLRELAGHRP